MRGKSSAAVKHHARGVSLELEAREPRNLKRSKNLHTHIRTTRPRAITNGKGSHLPVFGSLSILFCSVCAHSLASHVSPRGRLMDCRYAAGREVKATK